MSRTALMNAAMAGDAQAVRDLIAKGANVHARDYRGWTALDLAAAWAATENFYEGYPRYEQTVKALLDAGSEISNNTITLVVDGMNAVYTREIKQAGEAMLALLKNYQPAQAAAEGKKAPAKPAEPAKKPEAPGPPPAPAPAGQAAPKRGSGKVIKVLLFCLLAAVVLAVLIPHLSK